MSAFYDQASLVVVPSGYKSGKIYAQKPLTTDGQLSFTRASNATRVASNGLIEKVRTNLILHSQDFTNAAWAKTGCTVTANYATAPDGTVTADRLVFGASGNEIVQTLTGIIAGAEYTVSFYAKTESGTFNFSFGNIDYLIVPATATTGWQRFTVTQTAPVTTRFPKITAAGAGTLIVWGFQVESGVATDYIATTTAAVSVGPVSGLPRLDYLNSSCPRLLLEPAATALTTFSEQIDNAAWGKQNVSVTANNTASPSGYVDADKIVEDTANSTHFVSNNFTASSAVPHTFSVFAKMGERKYLCFAGSNVGAFSATYDLEAGTVIGASGATASIENYGNGWYRCVAVKSVSTAGGVAVRIGTGTTATVASTGLTQSYLGDGTSGLFIWGVNVTASSYATSYLPTLSTSVTRVADSASKTGISSLIGQTEGTLFVEYTASHIGGNGERIIGIGDGTTSNRIILIEGSNKIRVFAANGGAVQWDLITSVNFTGTHKIGLAYANNNSVLYIDGNLINSDTIFSVPAVSNFYIGTPESIGAPLGGSVSQALVFKTRLTNAQLAELTTL